MLTVNKFLELPAFHEFKIVAGTKGLDNIISSVNIMDNPDALDWFSPGELLLTSGYFFKDSSEIQSRVVRQLRSINCPALCIKPKRYLGNIPQNIILLADQLNLPVIELPYGIPFSKISNIIREEISGNYDIVNKKSLDIHKSFFSISLQGGGVSKIAQSLSEMISNPVILLDKYFNIVNWWDIKENPYPIKKYLTNNSNNIVLDAKYLSSLPPEFELLQKPLERQLNIGDHTIDTVISSVYIQHIHYGYVLVWKTVKELSDIDYIALEHSTMSFALERIRNNEIERAKNRVRRDFLDELLMGKITDVENLEYLCDIYRINMNLSYVPMVFSLEFYGHEEYDLIEKKRYQDEKVLEILKFLDSLGENRPYVVHSLSIHGQIILLIGFKRDTFEGLVQPTKNICMEIVEEIESNLNGITIYAGIGGISSNLMDLHHYFNQAMEALRLTNKSPSHKKICHFNDFVVHQFLEENVSPIEMRKFFESALGSLYKYDKENDTDFIHTLQVWIENNFNIAKTSRQLYTHRNTVLYRMDKISNILNSDLKDANELLKYQLALKIYKLLEL